MEGISLMEESYIESSVRTRLIIAGISELEERGIRDFSLRRCAIRAQVSCAAPYRHFRDKEDFLSEIIKYIASRWELLYREIEKAFSNDLRRRIIELAVLNLRFWIANPNYRSVFMSLSPSGTNTLLDFDGALLSLIEEYCVGTEYDAELKKYAVRALIYGSLTLAEGGDRAAVTELLRKKMEEEFPKRD